MTNVAPRAPQLETRMDYDPVIEAYQASAPEISLVSIGNILLRHRWLLIMSVLMGYIIFAFATYTPNRTYTATTTFAPRARGAQSLTSSVLSQLGIQASGGGSGGAYYMEVIRSPRILGPVAEAQYSFQTDTGMVRGRLIDIYGLGKWPPRNARAQMINVLVSEMKTTSQAGGIMRVSITTPWAALSAQVAQRILDELNTFNLAARQEQASSERQFVESRAAEAKIALSNAENALQTFINENQYFQPISPLALEWDRLKREVSLRQELYTQLEKALDNARIEEVRDNPVLSVIEPAEPPLGPDGAQWPRKAILGALIGLFVGILIAFLHAYLSRSRETYSDEYAEMERLKKEASLELRAPWKPLVRILSTGRP